MRRRRWAWVFLVAATLIVVVDVLSIWFTLIVPAWKNVAFGVSRGAFGLVSSSVPDVADRFEISRASTNEEFYWWFDSGGIMGVGYVVAPLWIAFLVAAAICLWLWRTSRVLPPWLCTNCGYDRRGLTEAGACPECGMCPARVPPAVMASRAADDAAEL